MKKIMLIPLTLFGLMLIFLAVGLSLDPKLVPSPLVGKAIPSFRSSLLLKSEVTTLSDELKGTPYLLNVWASWCSACRVEHPLLLKIANTNEILVIGLNYKDRRSESIQWLRNFGNPYKFSFFDPKGRIGMDLGVYGVPETFLIDAEGTIIHKHIGPLDENVFQSEFLGKLNGRPAR